MIWQDIANEEKPWITQENYDDAKYGNTSGDTAISYCENSTLGGYDDWRMPTLFELNFLVHAEKSNLIIDPIFQNTQSNSYCFKQTTMESSNLVYMVDFNDGSKLSYLKTASCYPRCVRGEYKTHHTFIPNETKQVAYDEATCLMWQNSNDSLNTELDWEGALEYCHDLEFAGFNDWRLPNINELSTISGNYWSSTTDYNQANRAKAGIFNLNYKSNKKKVRCVRFDN